MAVDRVETPYHLTPRGWINGSVDSMWKDLNRTADPPADRVETSKHKTYQSSAYSPEENSWCLVWEFPDASAEDRKALHEGFLTAGMVRSQKRAGNLCEHSRLLIVILRVLVLLIDAKRRSETREVPNRFGGSRLWRG
jgi:hypothetical protein